MCLQGPLHLTIEQKLCAHTLEYEYRTRTRTTAHARGSRGTYHLAQLLSFWMMQGMSWLHCLMARATLTAHLAFLRNLHLDLDAHISSSSSVSASSSAMRSSTWECTSGRHCEAQAVMFLN